MHWVLLQCAGCNRNLMTEFFNVENLTWPKVAALPHSTPPVLLPGKVVNWQSSRLLCPLFYPENVESGGNTRLPKKLDMVQKSTLSICGEYSAEMVK